MKRSRRVVLMFMGSAAASTLAGKLAQARDCEPSPFNAPPPGPRRKGVACNTRGGFGGSPGAFAAHPSHHGHAGG